MLKKITKFDQYNCKSFQVTLAIVISFMILALFNIALIAALHRLPQGYDMQFYQQEMRELMKGGFLPQ